MRLSVVVPCHDAAQHLPTTFASMRANAADDVEWILVDDGSRDETAALLAGFVPPAGRAVVLTNPDALGLAGARNTGTAAATGRFVTYLDADDWYAPRYASRLADAIEALGVDFVRVDHVQSMGTKRMPHIAPETRRGERLHPHDGIGTRPDRTTMVDYPYAWSAVYDRRLSRDGLLTVDPRLKTAEDRLMAWRLHLYARSYAVVGLQGYFYRRGVPGSLTAIGDERQLHFFDAFDLIGEELGASEHFAAFEPKWVRSYLGLIAHHEASRERLHPHVHRAFRRRARTTIRSLPQPLVTEAVAALPPGRARILRALS
ncbi:glycosyltransferase family 2 protein [Amnibacterium sp. CER49]|uniref:glycosyltransferase family 2 protein n=1 Tax=Amnibacterium sp. CER49 TaxID=3039161 RepID=UPI0024497383|nr:glycosyltransferase family 2 protein [Amnibacterium sp. CER49]MDH2445227.1 glycosyltransferase family 2 protein [Amnibacterium sp. CER49]